MTKKGTFPKVLIHRFCPKIELSFIAVITEIMLEKIVVRYFGQKTIIFRPKNLSFKKGQKMKFSKGDSSWILSKLRTFPGRSFSGKLFQKRSFLVLWKEKNDFKRKILKV